MPMTICPLCASEIPELISECPNCGAAVEIPSVEPPSVSHSLTDSSESHRLSRPRTPFLSRKFEKRVATQRILKQILEKGRDFARQGNPKAALEIYRDLPMPTRKPIFQLLFSSLWESLQKQASPHPVLPQAKSRSVWHWALLPVLVLASLGAWTLFQGVFVFFSPGAIIKTATPSPAVDALSAIKTDTPIPSPSPEPRPQPIYPNNLTSLKQIESLSVGSEIISLDFSPDGLWLASGDVSGSVTVWDIQSRSSLHQFAGRYVSFSPNGNWLAVAGDAGLYLYSVQDWSLARAVSEERAYYSVAFSPDGQVIAAGANNTRFYVWNANDFSALQPGGGFSNPVHSLSFSTDGRLLVAASKETIYVWNMQTQRIERSMPLSQSSAVIESAAIDPDGEWFAHGQKDGQMYIWRVSNGETMKAFNDETQYARALLFLPETELQEILITGNETSLSFWRMQGYSTELVHSIYSASPITKMAIAPQNALLAVGCEDGEIRLWGVFP